LASKKPGKSQMLFSGQLMQAGEARPASTKKNDLNQMKKYFEILELDMSASIEAVEQAYKELTQAWRPESYQNLPRFKRKAEMKLKEINEAYEHVRSYLLAKPSAEQPGDQRVVAETLSESIEETRPNREPPQPQVRKPARRSLRPGLIAVVAVLGTLVLYQALNRPKPEKTAPKQEKPASETQSMQASAEYPQKETDPRPPGLSGAANKLPAGRSVEPTAAESTGEQEAALKKTAADEALLRPSVLDRTNQDPERVKRIQKSLRAGGYDTGPLDGIIGPQTAGALKQFARDRAIEAGCLFADDLTGAVLLYAEIAATHPDGPKIICSDDFGLWLDRQTHFQAIDIQKLKKSATARQVVEILDRYKSDRKISRD
jgi:hypothetical protein